DVFAIAGRASVAVVRGLGHSDPLRRDGLEGVVLRKHRLSVGAVNDSAHEVVASATLVAVVAADDGFRTTIADVEVKHPPVNEALLLALCEIALDVAGDVPVARLVIPGHQAWSQCTLFGSCGLGNLYGASLHRAR